MEKFKELLNKQKAFVQEGRPLDVSFRLQSLRSLKKGIQDNERQLIEALAEDLGKTETESYLSEIGFVLNDIANAINNLPRWSRKKKVRTPLIAWPSRSFIYPEPYGSVLIIGPWNYPLQLLLSPLVGAMAAGNCAVLKPSEFAPATGRIVCNIFKSLFPENYMAVIQGDEQTAKDLVCRDFDFIFFTGSSSVGRQIMSAAAENLTPVTLELGGKCPCIVCEDADIEITARRIAWGKLLNAGQTCVAPDYVLAHESVLEPLLNALSDNMCRDTISEQTQRVINTRHFDRLAGYLEQGSVYAGGKINRNKTCISPTIMINMDENSDVMKEEIFGPILPVLPFKDLDDAICTIRTRPKPLALYLFTRNKGIHRKVISETSSGGVCINDTVSHLLNQRLPFGGIGESGMGAYHGKASFDCFTHFKSALKRSTVIDPKYRYLTNNSSSLPALRHLYRFLMR